MGNNPDPTAILDAFAPLDPSCEKIVRTLRDGSAGPLFVMGKNAETEAVLKRLPVAGIIDDYAPPGQTWKGHPLVAASSVPPGAVVINTSTSIAPLSAARRIRAIPGVRPLAYADLMRPGSLDFPCPQFVGEARDAFLTHKARWQPIYGRLADPRSRQIFEQLLTFRLTADASAMAGCRVALNEQYFEPFAAPPSGAVFVDCGGFDGDTTEEFARHHPDFSRVYFFEPSTANLEKARSRLAAIRDIVFVGLGVSDQPGRLAFQADAGSASAISDSGDTVIEVTTLDQALPEPASFIKMDLEGWELPALKGAARQIVDNQPILAIAVYHRASDFWEIPEYVLSLGVDYDIFLRHYTEGWSESVMYFVPPMR